MQSEHKVWTAFFSLIALVIIMITVATTVYSTKRLEVARQCFVEKYSNCPSF